MSAGKQGGWKLTFRQDEIDTLQHIINYVLGRHEWALGERTVCLAEIDKAAHELAIVRVKELKEYIESVVG